MSPASSGAWRYVSPFALFLMFVALDNHLPVRIEFSYPLRVIVVSLVAALFSRRVLSFTVSRFAGSVLLGLAVFAVWIAPDLLWPGYRDQWLFQNPLTGVVRSSIGEHIRRDGLFLSFRVAGTVALVPVIEEVFWRAWLMRYLISRDFQSVPMGTYAAQAFWLTALLFATEHGPYWDVGLVAGVAYNWWMVRTRNLANCILAHAVTNACLAAYVLAAGKWEYWL